MSHTIRQINYDNVRFFVRQAEDLPYIDEPPTGDARFL